jgi:topoisomerase-4 subunit A
MAYVKKLFDTNFLHYASYVIKDRAIPDLADGLKPVQRRIIHSLLEMDDGKFHKVANVVGHCMKYHPHGDQSIYSALVVLANKGLFIDEQGNFGNILTGDEASAARYIECRINALAKEVLSNPAITEYVDSYDGRNKEPVAFPAKVPVLLALGAEGIAVGMSTKILPHNFLELLEAQKAALRGQRVPLYPDFPSGGLMEASGYLEGNGKVAVRARLDTSDPKRIVIREIPFGTTTESLIASIEAAGKAGKIKIAGISDFTTENVEIEIKLARGVYSDETVAALYAYTDCEVSISCNLLVIRDGKPVTMSVPEVIDYHAALLRKELELERGELEDKIHARTLERIFIEERVYKRIEEEKTQDAVQQAVLRGLEPFKAEIRREVTLDDVERLLKIPIRRISLYDINKAKEEMAALKARLAEVKGHLKAITEYAEAFLDGLIAKTASSFPRRTELTSFSRIAVRDVIKRDRPLRYDPDTGYLGTAIEGKEVCLASEFDRVLFIRKDGTYMAVELPEKLFVGKGMLWAGLADKDELAGIVFSMVYLQAGTGHPYIKRFSIEQYITGKEYSLVQEGDTVAFLEDSPSFSFVLKYKPKPRAKLSEEEFSVDDFLVKGVKAQGVRLAQRELRGLTIKKAKKR